MQPKKMIDNFKFWKVFFIHTIKKYIKNFFTQNDFQGQSHEKNSN